jgi:selenocysteine lyase/cysteine desulfurase
LRHLQAVGIDMIHERVTCLAGWLIDGLTGLRHANGRPLVRLHGPKSTAKRGGTVTVSFDDPEGVCLDDRRIEELANHARISLRTGCFCNPGAGELAHGLNAETMRHFFQGQAFSFQELRQEMHAHFGKEVSAVRMSVGLASNFGDVDAMVRFATGLLNLSAAAVGGSQTADQAVCSTNRDAA